LTFIWKVKLEENKRIKLLEQQLKCDKIYCVDVEKKLQGRKQGRKPINEAILPNKMRFT